MLKQIHHSYTFTMDHLEGVYSHITRYSLDVNKTLFSEQRAADISTGQRPKVMIEHEIIERPV
jgi:hypothetical protein